MADESSTSSGETRKKAIARARDLLDARKDGNELWKIIGEYEFRTPNIQTEDRATALVLGAILEQGLETSILSHCVFGWGTPTAEEEQRRLFSGGEDGAMTLAIKIRLGYALGVYGPDSRDDLDMMRRIRNLFAHDKGHLKFDDPAAAGLCAQIKWIDKFPWEGVLPKPILPRHQYIQTTRHYFSFLDGATGKGVPIKYSDFPAPELYA